MIFQQTPFCSSVCETKKSGMGKFINRSSSKFPEDQSVRGSIFRW